MGINVSFTSLGCDKNLVDTEIMLGLLDEAGYNIVSDDTKADVIIINTCCFINDAKQESIENIIELGEFKENGNCKALIVTGCLAERYKDEIFKELPEVDAIVGTNSYENIVEVIDEVLKGNKIQRFKNINENNIKKKKRIISTPGYYEYLKIAEGCDNCCTYCIIPKIRGRYKSRSIEILVEEATELADQGIKELIIIAQDTTRYGIDLYGKKMLPELLRKLCEIENIDWIRIMYCYPEEITDELIEVIASEEKICNYLDMPIQHANDYILKKMARRNSQNQLRSIITKLRAKIPDICIRTTLIVGFPGETEVEFEDLYNFVKETRFDRLGVFTYSKEEDTPAAQFENQVDEQVKEQRRDKIMMLQKSISEKNTQNMINKTLKVIIDGKLPQEDNIYCGRTYKDAPDIDGIIFLNSEKRYLSGDFVEVKVVGAYEYDLIGEEDSI